MGFVKVVKNKQYFKRYQVKYKRRRQGKTDYQARRRLVVGDRNKYNTPKYRMVVRMTGTDIVAQIIHSEIKGDIVHTSAYAHELPRYGVKLGLTNYASAYCVGLLLARRHLKKLSLDSHYQGVSEVTGEDYYVEQVDDAPGPFRAVLDTGLARTSTGAKIFAAMKGAVDGGLDVPHSEKRFFGYDEEEGKYSAEAHRHRLMGGHVADYMRILSADDEDAFKRQFSRFIKEGITADSLESIYKNAHAAIRKDPTHAKKTENKEWKRWTKVRNTKAGRDNRVQQRMRHLKSQMGVDE
jgi:large subunit ribosomal protein L5e